jgi:hypothetical protein
MVQPCQRRPNPRRDDDDLAWLKHFDRWQWISISRMVLKNERAIQIPAHFGMDAPKCLRWKAGTSAGFDIKDNSSGAFDLGIRLCRAVAEAPEKPKDKQRPDQSRKRHKQREKESDVFRFQPGLSGLRRRTEGAALPGAIAQIDEAPLFIGQAVSVPCLK